MGRPLSQRLARVAEGREQAERVNDMVAAFEQQVEKYFPHVEKSDDRAELRDLDRNPAETARSRMRVHLRTYGWIAQNVINQGLDAGGQMQEIKDWIAESDAKAEYEDTRGESDQEIWQRERSEDLQNNFIYIDYLDSVARHGYRNYAVHLDYRGIRAAVHLLTTHTDGEQHLRELYGHEQIPVPSRSDAMRFKESSAYHIEHPEMWIEAAIRAVPGIYSAGHLLLTAYSEVVGIERDKLKKLGFDFEDTPLPIDLDEISELDGEEALAFEQRRLEAAITAYVTGEGNINEIPTMYGVPRGTFRKALAERNIKRKVGGDVRKYRTPAHREEG